MGKNYLPFYEFSGVKHRLQENLKKDFLKLREKLRLEKIFKKGVIEPELEKVLEEYFLRIIEKDIILISRKIEEFYSLLRKGKIDLVLLISEDDPFSRAVVQLARQFKTPVIIFQHGGIITDEIGTFSNANYYFIIGKSSKNLIKKNSSNKTRVKIIGAPRYDFFKRSRKIPKKQIMYAMEVANEDIIVPNLHLTKKRQKEILRKIFRVMNKFPDHKLILKIRPGWSMKNLLKMVAKEEKYNNFEVVERADNVKLINESKIILVNHTTMGIEALLLNKPIISISHKGLDKRNPYKKIRGIDVVYSQKKLESAIKRKLNQRGSEVSRNQLKKHVTLDGKASKRANKIIQKVLQKTN